MKTEELFLICDCSSPEHHLNFRFLHFDDERYAGDETGAIYVSTFLNTYRGIFKRIWIAIKYIFGYKSKYGEWDEIILNDEKRERLRRYLNKVARIEKKGNAK